MKVCTKRGAVIVAASIITSLISQTVIQFPVFLSSAVAVDPVCVPTNDSATIPGYTVLTFSTTGICSWSVPDGITIIDSLLVVGGGGGGAGVFTSDSSGSGGGGGGGGVYFASSVSIPSSVTIQVGAGGTGGGFSSSRSGNNGARGLTSGFGTVTAGGGGGGGCEATGINIGDTCTTTSIIGGNGTAAGSGGGTSNYYNAYNPGGAGTASSTTFNGNVLTSQIGYSGGYYNQGGSSIDGAGGPGGGARGAANYNTRGIGFTSNINGSSIEYGKGGGAYGASNWTFTSSTPGYGTGGGGRRSASAAGATGAQGVVIVKFKVNPSAAVSVGIGNLFFRTAKTITATPNISGKLTFKANNRNIPGCKRLSAFANTVKTCSFKPSNRGYVTLSVTLVPTDALFATTTTQIGSYFVYTRISSR